MWHCVHSSSQITDDFKEISSVNFSYLIVDYNYFCHAGNINNS